MHLWKKEFKNEHESSQFRFEFGLNWILEPIVSAPKFDVLLGFDYPWGCSKNNISTHPKWKFLLHLQTQFSYCIHENLRNSDSEIMNWTILFLYFDKCDSSLHVIFAN